MTTTTAYRLPGQYMQDEQRRAIYAYINGGDYTQDEQEALVSAMFSALRDEVNDRLPGSWQWIPATTELLHDVDDPADPVEGIGELFSAAWESVFARFEEIEAATLPVLPVTAIDREVYERADGDSVAVVRAYTRLIDEAGAAQAHFAARRRREIQVLLSRPGATQASVAKVVGMTQGRVSQIVSGRA